MTEEDLRHTHQIQRKLTKDDFIYSMTGLVLAGLIAIGSVGGGIYLIATGHDWAGVSVVGGTLVSLIGTFIYGTNQKNDIERT